jgi:hypothetical protein
VIGAIVARSPDVPLASQALAHLDTVYGLFANATPQYCDGALVGDFNDPLPTRAKISQRTIDQIRQEAKRSVAAAAQGDVHQTRPPTGLWPEVPTQVELTQPSAHYPYGGPSTSSSHDTYPLQAQQQQQLPTFENTPWGTVHMTNRPSSSGAPASPVDWSSMFMEAGFRE